jgi:ribosomal-protein-serine acetyltransferase
MLAFDLEDGVEVREWELADAERMFAEVDQNRDRLREWLPWVDATRSPDDSRAFLERVAASESRHVACGIFADGVIAGAIGLELDDDRGGEIGFWTTSAFEGRGLVTRASRAMLAHGFETLSLVRIQLAAAVENTRSRAVAERLGMTQEGLHRMAGRIRDDRFLDMVVYAILADEWRTAQGSPA